MLQRLPMALTQLKVGNTSANILNEICQIIYLFYQSKEIAKNIYQYNGFNKDLIQNEYIYQF